MFSDKDPITGGGDRFLRSLIRTARAQPEIVIKDAGHFVQDEKSGEISPHIPDFVKRAPLVQYFGYYARLRRYFWQEQEPPMSLRATCPLAFAEALAQAGQGLARLLESYGEQAGGSVAMSVLIEVVPKHKQERGS